MSPLAIHYLRTYCFIESFSIATITLFSCWGGMVRFHLLVLSFVVVFSLSVFRHQIFNFWRIVILHYSFCSFLLSHTAYWILTKSLSAFWSSFSFVLNGVLKLCFLQRISPITSSVCRSVCKGRAVFFPTYFALKY